MYEKDSGTVVTDARYHTANGALEHQFISVINIIFFFSFNGDIVNPNSFTRSSAWPITVKSDISQEMKVTGHW